MQGRTATPNTDSYKLYIYYKETSPDHPSNWNHLAVETGVHPASLRHVHCGGLRQGHGSAFWWAGPTWTQISFCMQPSQICLSSTRVVYVLLHHPVEHPDVVNSSIPNERKPQRHSGAEFLLARNPSPNTAFPEPLPQASLDQTLWLRPKTFYCC